MKRFAFLAAVVGGVALASPAYAASGPDLQMERVAVDPRDTESLQRGARLFVNYCLNCHSAKYMRYNRLTDLGLTEGQIADNLLFTGRFEEGEEGGSEYVPDKIGDTMRVAIRERDAKAWFGAPPPDLSVISRVRGPQWLYNYLLGFYRDERSATGWNNLVYPNVAMPHVLWELQGPNNLTTTEFDSVDAARAQAIAQKRLTAIEPLPGQRYVVKTIQPASGGTLDGVAYRRALSDLVNFLDYMGEPAKATRVRAGIVVMLYLIVLFTLVYWLKRVYWRDVH